jgi:hypothetical protein
MSRTNAKKELGKEALSMESAKSLFNPGKIRGL